MIMVIGMMLFLSSCAVNQGITLNYSPVAHEQITTSKTVSVNVSDERPYIKDQTKPPAFIGKFRGGFGNPWNAYTENKVPLAQVFATDLVKEVKSLGLNVQTGNADITIKVDILDYNFDALVNGHFWYEIKLSILDQAGAVLKEKTFKDDVEISGSVWIGPMVAFKNKLPELHQQLIQKMVRENTELIDALR
ncbi:MAG: hypothetical protein HQL22_02750 [Candidatus Omnitrophica bacterium]|nr:hypothetical protein [Candidatus Omnitrophota bacterium]